MRLRRDFAYYLEIVCQGDLHPAQVSQEAVKIPLPATQPISRFIERQPGHQRGVNPIVADWPYRLGFGFQNSKLSSLQV